ncbi:MAG: DUF924 domain-containing protein [Cellvibrionales bacterium]|nr:DUF924 domain-containing protein [Cellvibrionales bacterium]
MTSQNVLDFWFTPSNDRDLETHKNHVQWQMRGEADAEIIRLFADCTEAASIGELDNWAETPQGRLALIIVLDQFSRSVFRDDKHAFMQDDKALMFALESLVNGDYDAFEHPWEKTFINIAITHAEGPDLLERIDATIVRADAIVALSPEHLKPIYQMSANHNREIREVIASFGRYPHRNNLLGRETTPEEAVYLAKGDLPHQRQLEVPSRDASDRDSLIG